jgi:cytochrome c biogenesis protein CcmG, thiol:disulfide interchange protein DsbE
MSENSADSTSAAPRYSPALIVLLAIPLIGLAVALGILLAELNASPAADGSDAPRVGSLDQQMPDFEGVDLTTLDGVPVDLAAYRGRPIFVNFWATWCGPCVDELPELQAFAASQGANGAAVVAVNSSEETATIERYFDQHSLALPDIDFVLDPDLTVYRWFGVSRMPTTFLVDETGIVRTVKYGAFTSADDLQAYVDALPANAAQD